MPTGIADKARKRQLIGSDDEHPEKSARCFAERTVVVAPLWDLFGRFPMGLVFTAHCATQAAAPAARRSSIWLMASTTASKVSKVEA